jgi:hypothetical protein
VPTPGRKSASPEPATDQPAARAKKRRRINLRSWLRAIHRDVGYLTVGLTLIYAVSGLAVNHIDDWNANYVEFERTHQLAVPLPSEDADVSARVLSELGIEETPDELFRISDEELEILFDNRTLTVNITSGEVLDRGQTPRVFVRVANWLHLNRGKKAWTYIADGYALLLLLLALSGMFMLPGRKGLLGRGGILIALGGAVPIAYVVLSGGP